MSPNGDTEEISRMLHFVPQIANIFDVKEKVGEGTFSKVFRATVKSDPSDKDFALKYLIPTSKPSRIASELQCLKEVGGTSNIVGVEFCFMNGGHVVIVMPYFPHQRFVDYIKYMTTDDIRNYMRNLFVALSKIHAHGIIHRDIKPNNFLYDQYKKTYALVDFGLAQRASELQPPMTSNLGIRQPLSDLAGKLNKSASFHTNAKIPRGNPERFLKRPFPNTPILLNKNVKEREYPIKKKFLKDSPFNRAQAAIGNLPTPPATPSIARHQIKPERPAVLPLKSSKAKECLCFRKPTVCKVSLNRALEDAPRGGTPGFRAPEVLLKFQNQTTAIDMWSAGVILLSILSRKYPFFRADDDLTTLAEIIFLVGTEEMKAASLSLGKSITVSLPRDMEDIAEVRAKLHPRQYLFHLCTMIQQEQVCSQHQSSRNSQSSSLVKNCSNCYPTLRTVPESVYDLLNRLLDPNPHSRISAEDALSHPFIIGL